MRGERMLSPTKTEFMAGKNDALKILRGNLSDKRDIHKYILVPKSMSDRGWADGSFYRTSLLRNAELALKMVCCQTHTNFSVKEQRKFDWQS